MTGTSVEIWFSLDTTCPISFYLNKVIGQVISLIQKLQADIPRVRCAIFSHGDYCSTPYITKHIDFSANVRYLGEWLYNVKATTGKRRRWMSWTCVERSAITVVDTGIKEGACDDWECCSTWTRVHIRHTHL